MIAAAMALALAAMQGQALRDSFPHADHRRLFTACASCHEGILTGDSATAMPPPQDCVSCHDGERSRRVFWRRVPPTPSNLRFDHPDHALQVSFRGDSAIACVGCHAMAGAQTLMEAGRARAEGCLDCHAHRAPAHLAGSRCTDCHRPLRAAVRLTAERISRFPKPPGHDERYVFAHAREAGETSCSVCHSRESCAGCHVNADRLRSIQDLGRDERVASYMRGRRVTYAVPDGHRAADFIRSHGRSSGAGTATCASCHARESCFSCHRSEERVAAVLALPRRTRGGAWGVELADRRPPDHTPSFDRTHRAAAAGGDATCSRCHTQSYCAACHDASASPGFHGANFLTRHSSSAYGPTVECAACHQTQAFCRDCHRETGRAAGTSSRTGRFHDAQPMWTLGHGGIARRAIETCAGCHSQADCLQCHSASRGWRVNPHGASFDAGMGDRNPAMCRLCHVGGPPRR